MEAPSKTLHNNNSFSKQQQNPPIIKKLSSDYKIVCTHLIDGIYQGFVNASYQRDGFGVLQTDQFQTYLGYFKYNRPNGLGFLIYTDGSIIYSHFTNGKLQGIGLSDNGHQIQLGTYKDRSMVGIGYQFSYKNNTWKMNTYHKGVPIEVIKEEVLSLDQGVPNILSFQSEILSLFLNYIKKTYFSRIQISKGQTEFKQDLNSFYIHPLNQSKYYFGYLINNKYSGLGCIYDFKNRQLCQAGMYKEGILNGYGLKISSIMNYQQKGYYLQGKKDGVFHIKKDNKSKFPQFNKEALIFDNKQGETDQAFKKRQRIHYYRQKDFLSLKHNLGVQQFQTVFQSSEYKAWKVQQQNDKKQKNEHNKYVFQNKSKSRQTPKSFNNNANVYQQKTSIQIMKEKVFNLMNNKDIRKNKNHQKSLIMLNSSKQMQSNDNISYEKVKQDDQIAIEQNPIHIIQTNFTPFKKTVTFNQKNYS